MLEKIDRSTLAVTCHSVSDGQLPQLGDIRIGEQGKQFKGKDGKVHYLPKKTDSFRVYRPERDEQGRRILFTEIMKELGDRPTEIPFMFLFNKPELNLIQYHGRYKGRKCACRGDGKIATRLIPTKDGAGKMFEAGTTRPCPCKKFDPEDSKAECGIHTVMSVILPFHEFTGGVFVFRSKGLKTAQNLKSNMAFIRAATDGHIAGLPLVMKITPFTTQWGLAYAVYFGYPGTKDALKEVAISRAIKAAEFEQRFQSIEATALQITAGPEHPLEQASVAAEFHPHTVEDDAEVVDEADNIDLDDDPFTGPEPVPQTTGRATELELFDEEGGYESDS